MAALIELRAKLERNLSYNQVVGEYFLDDELELILQLIESKLQDLRDREDS